MSQHCCCSMAMARVKASYSIPGPQYPSQDGMGMETHCISWITPLQGRARCKILSRMSPSHAMRASQVQTALQTSNILSSMADKPGTVSG